MAPRASRAAGRAALAETACGEEAKAKQQTDVLKDIDECGFIDQEGRFWSCGADCQDTTTEKEENQKSFGDVLGECRNCRHEIRYHDLHRDDVAVTDSSGSTLWCTSKKHCSEYFREKTLPEYYKRKAARGATVLAASASVPAPPSSALASTLPSEVDEDNEGAAPEAVEGSPSGNPPTGSADGNP
jgi:hypothetical protein